AAEGMARLSRAPTLLADQTTRSKLSSALRLVAQGEHKTPTHVAWPRDIPRYGEQHASYPVSGDRRRDRYDARSRGGHDQHRPHPLQHVGVDEESRQLEREAGRTLRRAGHRTGVALVGSKTSSTSDDLARQ